MCYSARGRASQTLMMLSTSSHYSLEDVAKVATGLYGSSCITAVMSPPKCWYSVPSTPVTRPSS